MIRKTNNKKQSYSAIQRVLLLVVGLIAAIIFFKEAF